VHKYIQKGNTDRKEMKIQIIQKQKNDSLVQLKMRDLECIYIYAATVRISNGYMGVRRIF